ncbi:hypothetical protein [Leptolyngbya sp. ST-U4]|uniref:hypothetical protein n=1 Tax=Leptolyngbya sp. ST-U4 TaxID=2933912 RepID=UPI003297DE8E
MTQFLEQIYQEFKQSNRHLLAKAVRSFRSSVDLKVCTGQEAIAFRNLMQENLSATDPEAVYWLSSINEIVQQVCQQHIEKRPTTPYLINRPGRAEVTHWNKRRWNDAPAPIRRTVESYMQAGWDLVAYDHWKVHGAQVELKKCDTLTNTDDCRGWHHSKTLLIDKTGKIVSTRNGKSSITE